MVIEVDSLYQLNVDDDIWQDVGLSDEYDGNHTVSEWLGNDSVRTEIRSLLELEQCEEKQWRLLHEWLAIQKWM